MRSPTHWKILKLSEHLNKSEAVGISVRGHAMPEITVTAIEDNTPHGISLRLAKGGVIHLTHEDIVMVRTDSVVSKTRRAGRKSLTLEQE